MNNVRRNFTRDLYSHSPSYLSLYLQVARKDPFSFDKRKLNSREVSRLVHYHSVVY
jgi:hypothetical protein